MAADPERHVDELLQARGCTRTVVAAVASTAAAIEIVTASDAVMVAPRSVALRAATGGSAVMFPLPVDLPDVAVVLSWHRRLTSDRGHAWLRALVQGTIIDAR
ncbi:LysR substrate-binding domain-containing protein [Microbacteriaceae bacterium 4G12]